ncbi:MAG: LuxR family transcriptional regulator [Pseudomonadota bacterium]|nr:LuxR family transcriptional regulator [Pseudomonadota bacterium]
MNRGFVPEFVSVLLQARTGEQLVKTVSAIVRGIGFDTFLYGSLLPNEANDPDIVVVTTMPYEWVARYDQMSYIEVDPRVQHCLRHVTPFIWDSTKTYGAKADAFLQDAARYGLRSGITLPLRSTTGENAMFGVNASASVLPDDAALQLAIGRTYTFASYFHEWFFHNMRSQRVKFDMPAMPEVSKRELEVLALAARGHSSKRIGRALGISESTANYHIASVKRKFHVRTRSQAVAQAVQTGLIR